MEAMFLVVTMVILNSSLCSRIICMLALQDGEKVISSSDKVYGSWGFGVLALLSFAFRSFVHSVFLEKELVVKTKLRIVPNFLPGTIAMTGNANTKHPVFSGTPFAGVASRFGCLRNTKAVLVSKL